MRAAPLIAIVALVTFLLERSGLLDNLATAGIDAFLLLKHPRPLDHVSIVGLSDAEYERQFGGGDRTLNYRDLERIIAEVAAAGPSAIGIDLDTSAHNFRHFQLAKGGPTIVWVAFGKPVGNKMVKSPVWGGASPSPKYVGLGNLTVDPDGVIRRYRRAVSGAAGELQPSFPWLLVRAYCQSPCAQCPRQVRRLADSADNVLINYSGARETPNPIPWSEAKSLKHHKLCSPGGVLSGRIALIGSTRSSCDVYQTPYGQKSGIYIVAEAIESELASGGVYNVSGYTAVVLDILIGMLIVVIHYYLNVRAALAVSLGALPVLSLTGSFFAFTSFARWFNFVPMIIAVIIHEMYEREKSHRQVRKAYEALLAAQPRSGAHRLE